MADYSVRLTKKAAKQLDKLPNQIASPILEAVVGLANNPRPAGHKKLKGRNAYRIRQGNYRVIYEIIDQQLIITVIVIGHRKEVYR